MYGVAFVASIASGTALPLEALVFGGSVTRYNDYRDGVAAANQFKSMVDHYVYVPQGLEIVAAKCS